MKGIDYRQNVIKSFIIISCASLIFGLSYLVFRILNSDLIYDGVKIDDFHVSNMTDKEALKLLRDKKERVKKKKLKLIYNDMEYSFPLGDIEFDFLYEEAVNKAYALGREGNVFERITDIIKARHKGVNIDLNFTYNKEKILKIVERVAEEIEVEAKDAEFHFNNGHIHITDEIVGKKVNKEALISLIEENIFSRDSIKIPVENKIPKISKFLLSKINGIIGEYSTSFLGSNQNRIENIRLSAKTIDGKILLPGQIMSFNETTGPIRKELGYKDATVISGGQYTSGVGGGVCQTSTTLYNALIYAGLTILERSPHSIPPKYVDLGRDAAVAENLLDLKFRNDFDYPIYISTEVKGHRLYVYIYGDTNDKDYTVEVESEIVEVIKPKEDHIMDKNLRTGEKILVEEGRNGYKVRTYRYIIKNGMVIDKETISYDYYKERNYIYRIGQNK